MYWTLIELSRELLCDNVVYNGKGLTYLVPLKTTKVCSYTDQSRDTLLTFKDEGRNAHEHTTHRTEMLYLDRFRGEHGA